MEAARPNQTMILLIGKLWGIFIETVTYSRRNMYRIRMSISQLLFRLARWIQPKEVGEIAKVEGALITLSESLTHSFGSGDEVIIRKK